jgi:hypothetical protein
MSKRLTNYYRMHRPISFPDLLQLIGDLLFPALQAKEGD